MNKHYSLIKNSNKDYVYLLNIDGANITLREPFNSISGTYGAIALTVYDDAFSRLKNNLWLLDLRPSDDINFILNQVQGFKLKDPSELQVLLYS